MGNTMGEAAIASQGAACISLRVINKSYGFLKVLQDVSIDVTQG